MQDYRKLLVYEEAFNLTKEIYELTKHWPREELYGLTAQIRRSVHSVNSNICEGVSRGTIADSLRFLYQAFASLKETENHLRLAFEVNYIDGIRYKQLNEKSDHIGRMLNKLISFKKALIAAPKPRNPAAPRTLQE